MSCPRIVRETISKLDGVKEVEFAMPTQTATASMENAEATLTKEQLTEAFKEHERFQVLEVSKK